MDASCSVTSNAVNLISSYSSWKFPNNLIRNCQGGENEKNTDLFHDIL